MNQMKPFSALAAAALACSAFCTAVSAQEIAQQSSNGVNYVTGGVGSEERQAMQEVSPQYNVKLTFADKGTGEYRSGADVEVRDMRGNVRLQANDAGPLLYAQLPPGRYRVTANVDGRQQLRTITVGNGGSRSAAFYWDTEPPTSMGR
ncbi:hypothetical protein GCM10027277_05160 [Pseudoduganella ginsengisoli]|uniref:Carboxypeptidase regulatory-like domain-containing protein n=1 Tax=Pseudoduganella ginsengisoli TaxID=1462440 RepID=A0A6L6Q410_9BURK|nr:carboxypeptidase regulatory-like domain-containing protein [Pseudoduganella ginsengisoli]MTW04216.1 carboxypeptidase regulatory-like domain-containing protein [Pseudoduganella ginsengisoli]